MMVQMNTEIIDCHKLERSSIQSSNSDKRN